jgi:hypothetical protein
MVGSHLGVKTNHLYTEDVFEKAASSVAGLKGLDYEKIGSQGHPVAGVDKVIKTTYYQEVYQQDTQQLVEVSM